MPIGNLWAVVLFEACRWIHRRRNHAFYGAAWDDTVGGRSLHLGLRSGFACRIQLALSGATLAATGTRVVDRQAAPAAAQLERCEHLRGSESAVVE